MRRMPSLRVHVTDLKMITMRKNDPRMYAKKELVEAIVHGVIYL